MATNHTCDICEAVPADFMITLIHNGDTLAVGAECIGVWAASITDALDQAARRDRAGAGAAPEPPGAAGEDWEGGYPQGRPAGPQASPEAGEGPDQEDAEAEQAPVESG